MNHRLYVLLTLAVALGLLLSACGGAGDEPADTRPAAQPTELPQSAGDAAMGKEAYAKVCAACHGPNGEGVTGLGKPFVDSEFIQGLSDDDLLAFIKEGRPASDAANTTGVNMPPKGGNPALTDDDLLDITAFLRTLH